MPRGLGLGLSKSQPSASPVASIALYRKLSHTFIVSLQSTHRAQGRHDYRYIIPIRMVSLRFPIERAVATFAADNLQ